MWPLQRLIITATSIKPNACPLLLIENINNFVENCKTILTQLRKRNILDVKKGVSDRPLFCSGDLKHQDVYFPDYLTEEA